MTITDLHSRLAVVHASILDYRIQTSNPPVIDHDGTDRTDALPGLRCLRDDVKRDYDVLDKVKSFPYRLPTNAQHIQQLLREPASSAPSTNAPYLIAVWDELVHARHPVAISRTFYPVRQGTARNDSDKRHVRGVKVDIVADNGTKWIRVNTIKNSRLMMEFREIDSYLTSDDEDSGPAQTEFDNSLLRMGRELLDAAKANPVLAPAPDHSSTLTTITPQVTIRLTRLNLLDSTDLRIKKTIQRLCDMGIDIQLGWRSCSLSPSIPKTTNPKLLQPTTNINLDLSALIALISDISHSSLPRTEKDTHARFEPPQHYLDWKKSRVKSFAQGMGADDESQWENPKQHSRALAEQAIREMSKGILEEIQEHTLMAASRLSIPMTNITFWTTTEARHRCLEIVSKIGGERERMRADALLGSTRCTSTPPVPAPGGEPRTAPAKDTAPSDVYWKHSRYTAGFLPLPPVRVYPSILPEDEHRQPIPMFFDALMRTCTQILSHSDPSSPLTESALDTPPTPETPPVLQTLLPKLTLHTVRSMLAGASRGYTTLTTNKSSVKVMLKEMRRICGACEPDFVVDVEEAVLWTLGPRSLSEGMRSE